MRLRRVGREAGSFLLGCLVGALFHYALYRMGLPLEPFIYMAF
jgi:hypothetical protein